MKHSFKFFGVFALATMAFSQNASAVTLEEALIAAYTSNPQLKAERKRLMSTNENASQAFAEWLPTISAEATKGRERTKRGTTSSDRNITNLRQVSLTQPIFDGGQTLYNMRRTEQLTNQGQAELDQVEQNVLLGAVASYVEVVRAQEVLKLSKHNEQVLQQHLKATEERFMLGEVTRTDVAQAKARLSSAISERLRSEGNLISAHAAYKHIVGEQPDNVSLPNSSIDLPVTLDDALAIALSASPLLKAAQYDELAAKHNVGVHRSELLPTVSLEAFSRRESGLFTFGGDDFNRDAVSVNLTVPLYQSGAEYSRVRQAKRTAENRRYLVKEAENQVVENVTSAWHDLGVARATIKSNRDAVKAAEVALKGVEQEAEVGSRTTLDVLDAEQEAFNARVNLVSAQSDEIIAAYNLKAEMGQLKAKDLGLEIDLYDSGKYYNNVKRKVIGF